MAIKEVTTANNQARIVLQGSIYLDDAADIMGKFIDLIDKGYTSLLIDLSAVDYIGSAGIGTLISMHKRVHKHDGSMVIKGVKGIVKDLFELTRVDSVLSIE